MLRRAFVFLLAALGVSALAYAQTPPAPDPPKVTLSFTQNGASLGDVEITLDPVGAPLTTAHMLRLFRTSHYMGAAIFRVEPNFLIQLGDLDAKLNYRPPPAKTVALETANTRHARGAVALARGDDPGSGQSSFYFDLAANPHLNADPNAPPNTTGYAVFGKVTAGMAVLDAIAATERLPEGGPFPGKLPKDPIVISAVRVAP